MLGKDPVVWCREMQEKAKNGAEAFAYHQMAELYEKRRQPEEVPASKAECWD